VNQRIIYNDKPQSVDPNVAYNHHKNTKLMKTVMKYANLINFCMLLFVTSHIGATSPNRDKVAFVDVNVEDAMARASQEGKLVFMDFYASWCTPCKWMEQTTLTDARVTKSLNSNFISVKVNIDDVEGFKVKNKYEVNYLPTILILNSNGKIVERIEQTMVADELVDILSIHNSPANKVVIKHDFNKSPKNISEDTQEADPWTISQDDYRRYREGEEKRNYKVQVGVYKDYNKAHEKVLFLRDTFIEPITVQNDFEGNVVLFKVMLGQFQSSNEADSFCKILKSNFDIDAIVQ